MTEPVIDKAALAQGAASADIDPATGGNGNAAPPAPPNEPPKDAATEKAAADQKAADEAKAAADAAAAAEAAKAKDDAPLNTELWGSTGTEVGDSVLTLLQNAGMTPDDAKAILFDAVKAGDMTKIDRDALVEKVGKAKAALILAGTENFIRRNATYTTTILKDVHEAVGGQENWAAVSGWAKANIPEAELAQYRAMLDAGGPQSRFAAADLASKYNADPKNSTLPAKSSELLGDGAPPASTRALTRAQYVAELDKAYASGASQAVIDEINAARAAGRAKNL
jgi:hypothetical protein